MTTEIIFLVEDNPEGGYTARAIGESIFTQANSLEELKEFALLNFTSPNDLEQWLAQASDRRSPAFLKKAGDLVSCTVFGSTAPARSCTCPLQMELGRSA